MSAPFINDPDFTLWLGDVREILPRLEPGSVDCVITSPPYWGLRDYGTGAWDGGDPDCDHAAGHDHRNVGFNERWGRPAGELQQEQAREFQFRDVCGKCGATRQDQQLGLEPTPDEYVRNMVTVFREVRRVLAPHGTCWVNLGDSYAAGGGFAPDAPSNQARLRGESVGALHGASAANYMARSNGPKKAPVGLKPKDLVGVPWRVAFALQADGWYLRSDIVWSKPNPMPESVTDRPTKAHEFVFLLTKQPRYWFDAEAVREPHATVPHAPGNKAKRFDPAGRSVGHHWSDRRMEEIWGNPAGRNVRSVWEIATQPYPEAHFATYPEELVRRALLAGCPEWVCRTCGAPRTRLTERGESTYARIRKEQEIGWREMNDHARERGSALKAGRDAAGQTRNANGTTPHLDSPLTTTLGWSDCGHDDYRSGRVLDPFLGSGTTALVARRHGRACVGIELNPEYAALAARRLQQLSLLAEGIA